MKGEDFDIDGARLPEPAVRLARTPTKILKRRKHFIQVPFEWIERLDGASGKVYALALHLRYLQWKHNGGAIKLANGMLEMDGVNRSSKWRALVELEKRGLISVERRPRRSSLVRVIS